MENHDSGGILLGAVVIVIALALYFLPCIVARNRDANTGGALFLVNLLLGWTLIGWLVCLLWAALAQTRAQAEFFERASRQ